jgi:hypothetical protein
MRELRNFDAWNVDTWEEDALCMGSKTEINIAEVHAGADAERICANDATPTHGAPTLTHGKKMH